MRPVKHLKQNIVIVCEGSETENNYFADIKMEIEGMPETCKWADIKIIPVPKEEKNAVKPKVTKRIKKTLKGDYYYYITQEDTKENYEIYKSQPTRYVREAQLLKIEGAYTDAWAVFDKDKHTDHNNAFKLSEESNVNIAFSSIAFEEWILLHFEKNNNTFNKVECKENGKSINCGSDNIKCANGSQCICGYLRENINNFSYEKNLGNLYQELKPFLNQAYENSAWLRLVQNNGNDVFNKNPYTNVDELVRLLLNNKIELSWAKLNEDISFDQQRFKVEVENNIIKIINIGPKTLLLTKDNMKLSMEYFEDSCSIFKENIYLRQNENIDVSKGDHRLYLNYISGNKRLIIKLS